MQVQLEYILGLATKFNHLSEYPIVLFNAVNDLPTETLEEIYTDYSDADGRFQPVNILRAEICRRRLTGDGITIEVVEEIKQRIRDKDKLYFSHLSTRLIQQLLEYPVSTRDMFANWQKPWTIFHVFFYRATVLETTQIYLQQIAQQLLLDLDLQQYQPHCVDFYGPNNFGSDISWIALYPDNKLSHKDAYQFFILLSSAPRAGRLAGWNVRNPEPNVEYDFQTYDQVSVILEKTKAEILELNKKIRGYFKFAPGSQASEWGRFQQENIIALDFHDSSLRDITPYNSQAEVNIAAGLEEDKGTNLTWNLWLFRSCNIGDVFLQIKV